MVVAIADFPSASHSASRPETGESAFRSLPARGMGYTAFGTAYAPNTAETIENRYTYTSREKSTTGRVAHPKTLIPRVAHPLLRVRAKRKRKSQTIRSRANSVLWQLNSMCNSQPVIT